MRDPSHIIRCQYFGAQYDFETEDNVPHMVGQLGKIADIEAFSWTRYEKIVYKNISREIDDFF